MKILYSILAAVLLMPAPAIRAQDEGEQPPFIFTVYGGLFFPSNVHFKDVYNSQSELLYGFGATLPLGGTMFLAGDLALFKAEAFVDPSQDSSIELQERFYHLGIISKQPVEKRLFLRLTGGLNYVTIKQRMTSPQSPERSTEAEKKIGYFGGIGIEQMFEDGKASLFGDVIYDYRRSHQKELEGDFGGVRLVVGMHLFLF
ncbi:MAG: hypothetical protein HY033_02930 [Ignavibacteriae bacterium]|nr:hypothetical protein [Ignavibacteria bacterium]MBI3363841.1 hypothetical protein [Ignavibacteriota bacterium]